MWSAERTDDGSWTLRRADGVACHSTAGAWTQACERYAAPCRLRELAAEREVVRLLDVGTGLGLNLAAALRALDGRARLEATTLESAPSVIEAALALEGWPDEARPWVELAHEALGRVLRGGAAELADGRGSIELLLGDARESVAGLRAKAFDAVFLDPFAPRDEPELWDGPFLREVARVMAPEAILSTYSASFAVRVRLLEAGLGVGLGPRVGRKAQGTLASLTAPLPPLEPRSARRIAARASRRAL